MYLLRKGSFAATPEKGVLFVPDRYEFKALAVTVAGFLGLVACLAWPFGEPIAEGAREIIGEVGLVFAMVFSYALVVWIAHGQHGPNPPLTIILLIGGCYLFVSCPILICCGITVLRWVDGAGAAQGLTGQLIFVTMIAVMPLVDLLFRHFHIQATIAQREKTRIEAERRALEELVDERTTELRVANEALERLAHRDQLTGLLNRHGFEHTMALTLGSARRSGTPLSLLLVDADHFKRVNDTFGHSAGDAVLRVLADTLTSRLRSSDFASRMGGEEFVVVLQGTDERGALALAQDLVTQVSATQVPIVGRVTVSIGVSTCRVETEAHEVLAALLEQADLAMYRAKHGGRNQACAYSGGVSEAAPIDETSGGGQQPQENANAAR